MSYSCFIADTHLTHKNICKFRTQFSSVEEHDEVIVDNILTSMGKRDTLYILGDIAFSYEGWLMIEKISKYLRDVVGVLGNHDTENKKRRDFVEEFYRKGVLSQVHGFLKYKEFWLSHCPMHPLELRGKKNVHGHMHMNILDDPNYFSVCCEHVNYTPIRITEIRERILDAAN